MHDVKMLANQRALRVRGRNDERSTHSAAQNVRKRTDVPNRDTVTVSTTGRVLR
jgi:hypothetical protein